MGAFFDCLADEEELVFEAALAVLVGEFRREARADTDLVMKQPADGLGFFQAVNDDLSLEVVKDVVIGVFLHGLQGLSKEILGQNLFDKTRLNYQGILDQFIVIEQLNA